MLLLHALQEHGQKRPGRVAQIAYARDGFVRLVDGRNARQSAFVAAHDGGGFLQERLATSRQPHMVAVAHEQPGAQFVLHRGDVFAEHRLAHVETLRRRAEAQRLGHVDELTQMIDVHACPRTASVNYRLRLVQGPLYRQIEERGNCRKKRGSAPGKQGRSEPARTKAARPRWERERTGANAFYAGTMGSSMPPMKNSTSTSTST